MNEVKSFCDEIERKRALPLARIKKIIVRKAKLLGSEDLCLIHLELIGWKNDSPLEVACTRYHSFRTREGEFVGVESLKRNDMVYIPMGQLIADGCVRDVNKFRKKEKTKHYVMEYQHRVEKPISLGNHPNLESAMKEALNRLGYEIYIAEEEVTNSLR